MITVRDSPALAWGCFSRHSLVRDQSFSRQHLPKLINTCEHLANLCRSWIDTIFVSAVRIRFLWTSTAMTQRDLSPIGMRQTCALFFSALEKRRVVGMFCACLNFSFKRCRALSNIVNFRPLKSVLQEKWVTQSAWNSERYKFKWLRCASIKNELPRGERHIENQHSGSWTVVMCVWVCLCHRLKSLIW